MACESDHMYWRVLEDRRASHMNRRKPVQKRFSAKNNACVLITIGESSVTHMTSGR